MRSKLPWYLLAASVALNIFFVAGVFYPHTMGHRPDPQHLDPVAAARDEFSLDAGQIRSLEAVRDRIAERRNANRGDRGGSRAVILEALKAPAFDRAALALALEERRSGSGDMILDMAEDLHGFLAGLSAEQKAAFLERAQDRDFLRSLLFPPRPRQGRGG
ncbi:MAG: periplasmic heavy metal sensor [Kiloniellaceae bacterium]